MTVPAFSGVYPILYAFYDAQGHLDDGLMRLQVEKCIATGADGIAVVSALCAAEDPEAAARDLRARVDAALSTRRAEVRP